jgi:hypothetical protein
MIPEWTRGLQIIGDITVVFKIDVTIAVQDVSAFAMYSKNIEAWHRVEMVKRA